MPTDSLTPIYDQLTEEFTEDDIPPDQPVDPEIRTTSGAE